MTTDTRPRHLYRLPDGREVPIIFDHGTVCHWSVDQCVCDAPAFPASRPAKAGAR